MFFLPSSFSFLRTSPTSFKFFLRSLTNFGYLILQIPLVLLHFPHCHLVSMTSMPSWLPAYSHLQQFLLRLSLSCWSLNDEPWSAAIVKLQHYRFSVAYQSLPSIDPPTLLDGLSGVDNLWTRRRRRGRIFINNISSHPNMLINSPRRPAVPVVGGCGDIIIKRKTTPFRPSS